MIPSDMPASIILFLFSSYVIIYVFQIMLVFSYQVLLQFSAHWHAAYNFIYHYHAMTPCNRL
jgi:hypothetical protein